MSMKTNLERMCNIIDNVLAGHGLSAQVAGGYVAGNGILFSLTDTTFLNTQLRLELKEALQVPKVLATVGVVLVNDWRQREGEAGTVLEGSYEVVESPPLIADVETVDVLDLIEAHEADQENGRFAPPLLPTTKKAVIYTASSKTNHSSADVSQTSRP